MTSTAAMQGGGMDGYPMAGRRGRLILAPAPLDFGCPPPLPAIDDVLPAGTLRHMAATRYWVCENAKTLRALLKRVDAVAPLAVPLQEVHISELPRHWHKQGDHVRLPQAGAPHQPGQGAKPPEPARGQRGPGRRGGADQWQQRDGTRLPLQNRPQSRSQPQPRQTAGTAQYPARVDDWLAQQDDTGWMRSVLAPALAGHDVALASEAGMPAVADPGSSLVRMAHTLGLEVLPLTGPCALLLALAASGLNGQHFAFVGYLPQDAAARTQRLHALEHTACRTGQSQIWIETPYRNQALYTHAVQVLQPTTMLTVAQGLTLADARIHSCTIATHRQQPIPLAGRLPAVFGLGV